MLLSVNYLVFIIVMVFVHYFFHYIYIYIYFYLTSSQFLTKIIIIKQKQVYYKIG